jgi:prevent-host-death family protein
MIDISRDVDSLSEFKRNTAEFIKRLEKTGAPVLLTVNGKAKLVVQDAASYQRIRELLDQAETIEAIRQGLEDVARGKTVSLPEFERRMRKQIGRNRKQ